MSALQPVPEQPPVASTAPGRLPLLHYGVQLQRGAAAPRATHADHPFAGLILACALVGMLLSAADQTIVTAALPRMLAELSGWNQYSWVTTAFLLGTTVTMPVYGKLADLYEAKWIFLFGLLLFTAASALCGTASSMTQLVFWRALQGIGAGALAPVGMVMLTSFVTPQRRIAIQGGASALMLVATVAGPVIGGWLSDNAPWHWRTVFYINLPIGLAIALIVAAVSPRLRRRHRALVIDYLGTLLLALAVVPILLLVNIPEYQRGILGTSATLPVLVFTGVIVVTFLWHEHRHPEPILDPALLTTRTFAVPAAGLVLLSGITFISLVYIPLYVQGVQIQTATRGGLILAPLMLASLSGRLLGNWLQKHREHVRSLALASLVLVVAGAALLVEARPSSGVLQIIAAMLLLGVGLGAGNTVLFAVALASAPLRFGQVAGMLLFLRSLGGAAVIGAVGSVLAESYGHNVLQYLPKRLHFVLHSSLASYLDNPRLLLNHASTLSAGRGHPLLHTLQYALASSLHQTFLIMAMMAGLTIITLVAFPRNLPREATEAAVLTDGAGVLGETGLLEDQPERGLTLAQATMAWNIICHIIYWRYGTVKFATSGGVTRRDFNRFEATVTLPGSIEDPALRSAFERHWTKVRGRTSLDRYRAEETVQLLLQAVALDGDVAVCSTSDDGLALLLALLLQDLHIAKKVHFFRGETALGGAGIAEQEDGEPAAGEQSISTEQAVELLELGDMLSEVAAPPAKLARRVPAAQTYALIHIDYNAYATTKAALDALAPHASPLSPLVIGHFNDTIDGPRRAAYEYLRSRPARLYAGPLPHAYFFTTADPEATDAPNIDLVDWSALAGNVAYATFLNWIADEIGRCEATTATDGIEYRVKEALARVALDEPASSYLKRFANLLSTGATIDWSSRQ